MRMRTAANYDRRANSLKYAYRSNRPSVAVQSQKDDADINSIMKRFGQTGMLPSNVRAPTYGDFTSAGDFRSAMDSVRAAKESFMEMPAEVRKRFGNDPQLFVEFCSDEKNLKEMREMGLAIPEVVPPEVKPSEVVIVGDKREDVKK